MWKGARPATGRACLAPLGSRGWPAPTSRDDVDRIPPGRPGRRCGRGAVGARLVLTHRSSGFVNFAHAATGTYVALAFFEFRSTGAVVLPVLGLPARVQLLDRPTLATSLLMATVLSAAVGALVYALVVRPLRSSPPLSRVVASLGLMLYVQEMTRVRFPVSGSAVAPRQPCCPPSRSSWPASR